MKNGETVERAYSMASYPAEGREIMLNVRVATPPWDRAKNGWADVNPGIASSYIFSKKQGDKVVVSGPYGEFFINESEAEMLYVGGRSRYGTYAFPFVPLVPYVENWT